MVRHELRGPVAAQASGEDLLQLAKKNKLYEFIVEYCLREDWIYN